MATAPNLVVAGDAAVAQKLRETGRFPVVFYAASAAELRDLSKSGQVTPPAAFMFAPGFVEDVPGAGVAVLANGLAGSGFTVLVHSAFAERGEAFDPKVRVTGNRLNLSELLSSFGGKAAASEGAPASPATPPSGGPAPSGTGLPASRPEADTLPPSGTEAEPTTRKRLGRRSNGEKPAPAPEQRTTELIVRPEHLPVPASSGGRGSRTAPANPWLADTAPPARRGRVVAIAAAKGGVGKTSISVNLSAFAARLLHAAGRSGSVVLVDTNFQQADVGRYLFRDSPTIFDLLQRPGALSADSVRHHLVTVPQIGLHALLGPPEAVNADPAVVNSALYQRILDVLRAAFDFVFIDTPVAELYHTTFTDLILPEADAILVPVEPNRVTLEAAHSWLKAITTSPHSRNGGVDPEKLSLLLNRARTDVDCSPEDVMDLLPGWRFIGMIPEDEEWMHAVNNRRLIALQAGPELEATFRRVLEVVTADPVFGTAALEPPGNGRARRWRRLLNPNAK